jgi:hypothetical protein
MRNVTCFVLAAALATAPALAQNEAAPEDAVETNDVAAMPADNTAMVANDLAVAPAPVTTDVAAEPAAAPAPARRSGGFPWGVIGLVGRIGLLGRKRRD